MPELVKGVKPTRVVVHFLLQLLVGGVDESLSAGVAEILAVLTATTPWAEECKGGLSSLQKALSENSLATKFIAVTINNLILYSLDCSDLEIASSLVVSLSPLVGALFSPPSA